MSRVCSFDFSAHAHLRGEHLGGDPLFERLHGVLNLLPCTHAKRDAIADGETQFLPETLNATHQLSSQSLESQLARHDRIERGKIARFLLYHQLSRSGSYDRQIVRTKLTGIIPDRNVQRLPCFEIPQSFAGKRLHCLRRQRRLLAELLTQRPEIRLSL